MQFKKITAGLLAVTMAVTSLSEAVFAAPVDTPTSIIEDVPDSDASEPADTPENPIESDFRYTTLEDGTVEITGYTGSATELEIPSTIDGKSVTSIGDGAFKYCRNLTSINIPDGVTSIGSEAFYGCSSLTSITIPDSVTSIGTYSFDGCSSLASITIPSSVTSIGDGAFNYCRNLTSITVDDNNKYYSSRDGVLFNKDMTTLVACPGGKAGEYVIPDSVTSIGYEAFYNCSSLTSIHIPDGVTSIGSSTFSGCSSLASITIPSSVTIIGNWAFEYCSSLTSINIPDSVTSIGQSAFSGCSSLTSITVDDNNEYYSSRDGILFDKNMTELLVCPGGKVGEYVIPDSVTSIGYEAFYICSSLTSITIPDSVTSIESCTFWHCSSLTSINIPDSVTSIGKYAFDSCESLTSIDIPDSVTSIGEDAFYNTPLLDNQIGTVKYADKWIIDCDENADKAEIENGTVGLADSAFYCCSSLTSVTIPDSVTSIGSFAFEDCSSLTSINIPDSVTSIGYSAFRGTPLLDNQIGTVKYADKWVIDCDENADKAEIESGTVGIANLAFGYCLSLTSIDIPDGVTSIGNEAFEFCESLTAIDISDGVTSIGDEAFFGCYNLKDVYYDGLKAQWVEISIGSLNAELLDASIHYGKHIATDPIIENEIHTNCGNDGSYDEVVYCSDCGEELSRTTVTVPATGKHTASTAVKENVKDATCIADGSYDEVVYCSVCKAEITRKTVTVPATGKHTASTAVKENVKDATCIADGSYDEVIYCEVCGEEISRETVTVHAVGKHTPAESVKENEVEATCGTDGSYDEVVYCSECGEELSRTPVTVPATGKHTYVDKVVAPTYTAQGYTEHTCSVCGYSYKDTYTAKKNVPAVSGLKLKARAADALRLSWTKNTSADGYIIEMKSGNSWTRVGKITNNSTVEFKKSKLKAGTAYTFRVKAYKMDGKTALYSGYTTISARTNPSAISGLKLKARAADALRLTWSKDTSADGYIIEMKSGNSWVRVGKITNNATVEFKKSKLKAGTAYTFRVKAYKMSGKTALYGATKTISVRTNPSVVTGLKLKNSAKDAVRLSWTKNTSADGYIVEMKVNGVWKRAGKITKNSTVEFKKSGLKPNTSYTFRVKAYKMSGSTSLYGATKTITVKTK